MKLLLLCLVALFHHDSVECRSRRTTTPPPSTTPPAPMEDRMAKMESILHGISRQVMLQQFYVEEKIRSDGNSGLKQIRVARDGTRNYYQAAHLGRRFMAMHNHANYDRTVGLGEMMLVMNGVEFRTRHNDYKLRMPSKNSTDYHATEFIPFPPVPPSVTEKTSVDEQILEMREYFMAFRDQNITHRDYRPYFRANLCYIEGGWSSGTKHLDEPFQSDRHQIDADSWFDLMDKIRYTSYTGSKSVSENFAFLPTSLVAVDDDGTPHYAQWNYRIICHPLKDDLPRNVFKPDDDLLYRFPNKVKMDKVAFTRAQRYHLNDRDIDHYDSGNSLLDQLMMQIPGKDNYPCELHDNSFDMVMEDVRYKNHTLVNTCYYHRYFKTLDKGAMGTKAVHRGYSDANLFVAQTTHQEVTPMTVETCNGRGSGRTCKSWTSRYTYALPLEIVYMTPLQTWNPYDIEKDADITVVRRHGKGIGGQTADKAYNGTNHATYYLTPVEFYSSSSTGPKDPADTAKKGAGVLDKQGNVRVVSSSGIRIVTPDIEGVGPLRLRFPILPIHGEGSGVWKELNALKEMSMHMNRYASLFEERPGEHVANGTVDESATLHLKVQTTVQDPPGEHSHDFFLNVEELDELYRGGTLSVTTSEDMGHVHELDLGIRRNKTYIKRCDGLAQCWDMHPKTILEY